MNPVFEFFQKLFDVSDFPPRWHCGRWTEFHGWFYIISDIMVWTAYFTIPVLIVNYISRRKALRFHKIYFLFAAFILACGTTHLLDVITFWYPMYRLSALVRFTTGLLSWATVFALVKMLPVAFSLKTSQELEMEAEQRRVAEHALQLKNEQLIEAQELTKMGNWEWEVAADKIYWSEGLHRLYETDPAQNIDFETYLGKIHPDDREMVKNHIHQSFESKNFPDFFHRVQLHKGQEKIFHSRGEVITDTAGNVIKMIGTALDVTEQKRIEASLLEKTAELERINGELQQFAYAASHDLQEPLRKMRVFIDIMRRKSGDKEAVEIYAGKVHSAAERMAALIKSILDYSKIADFNQHFVPIDLNEVLENVKYDLELVIVEKNAVIKNDPMPVINGIPQQIQQLFANLINNALKFSKEAPLIQIRSNIVSGHQLQDLPGIDAFQQYVELVFSDNGIGFEEAYAEQIFTIFKRLDHQFSGTGIGLAICKKIVDNHKGYISASSRLGEGASFRICLPL